MSLPPKDKPCKGTGLAKGYGCSKPTKYRVYGLGKMCGCYSDWLLNSENGKIKLDKAMFHSSQTRRDFEKAEKEHKESKGLPALLVNVRTVCHTYIKLRDKGKPCISCGTPWNKYFQAGHYFKAETFSTIEYNELNISGQCQLCNLRKNGNFGDYSLRLPKRIGQEKFDEITQLAEIDKKINHKWDREKLKEIRKYYQTKIKEL